MTGFFMAAFWVCVGGLLYIYVGYPVMAAIGARIMDRRVQKATQTPEVTIVIAAHNEARVIRETIENKLALAYPAQRLEIVVVSDGSTDGTDEIVRGFAARGVRLVRQEPRQGKTAALNKGVAQARGEIIVFSDANSLYHPDAVRHLAANFADCRVGYVTGRMLYTYADGSVIGDGCSTYMRYEHFLRRAEVRLGSLVGVNGGIDAVRRNLYEPMSPHQQPDFELPLSVIAKGYRVVYEPNAILKEHALQRSADEYRMRVRVALRALHTLKENRRLLNPMHYGIYAYQLWSHKVLRYGAFSLMVGLYVSNLMLIRDGDVYQWSLGLQTVFYLAALAGWWLERRSRRSGLLYVPFYFSLLNIASSHAFFKLLLGSRAVTWTPRGG